MGLIERLIGTAVGKLTEMVSCRDGHAPTRSGKGRHYYCYRCGAYCGERREGEPPPSGERR